MLLQVLSANSTDVDAPLVLAPVRDGNPCQLWHQDHWRQFGNSKVTATLGLQDIDHLNKEAFVLINKATKKMLACGSHGEPMGLVDYASGCDGPAVRKLILMEPVRLFFISGRGMLCNTLSCICHAANACMLYSVFCCCTTWLHILHRGSQDSLDRDLFFLILVQAQAQICLQLQDLHIDHTVIRYGQSQNLSQPCF